MPPLLAPAALAFSIAAATGVPLEVGVGADLVVADDFYFYDVSVGAGPRLTVGTTLANGIMIGAAIDVAALPIAIYSGPEAFGAMHASAGGSAQLACFGGYRFAIDDVTGVRVAAGAAGILTVISEGDSARVLPYPAPYVAVNLERAFSSAFAVDVGIEASALPFGPSLPTRPALVASLVWRFAKED